MTESTEGPSRSDSRLVQVDRLVERLRLPVILYDVHGLSPAEIARALRLSEKRARARLEAGLRALGQQAPADPERESRPGRSLSGLTPLSRPTDADQVVAAAVLARAERRARMRRRSVVLKESGFAVLVLILVASLVGLNNLISPGPWLTPPPTELVTQIVRVTVLATPAVAGGRQPSPDRQDSLALELPAVGSGDPMAIIGLNHELDAETRMAQEVQSESPSPIPGPAQGIDPGTPTQPSGLISPGLPFATPPLPSISTGAAIRQKLLESPERWTSLWLDAQIVDYGPPGYVGPATIRHEQIWVSKPDYSLVLTGPANESPDQVWISVSGKVYDVDPASGEALFFELQRFRLPVYSELARLISPSELAIQAGVITPLGTERLNGRDVLVADWSPSEAGGRMRLWVDDETGLILRQRQFSPDFPGVVEKELVILRIDFDMDLPYRFFDRRDPLLQFARDYRGEAATPGDFVLDQSLSHSSGHMQFSRLPPPAGFSPSSSRLTFQWSQTPQMGVDIPVATFAGGYFLGELSLENPVNVLCDRSPDGGRLAYLGWADQAYALRWVDLERLDRVHNPFPELTTSGIFAFAPDSRQIAVHGCMQGLRCGVYLMDLDTGTQRLLQELYSVDGLVWSPDGAELAMIAQPKIQAPWYLQTVALDGSELTYEQEFDHESGRIPPDAPLHAWGQGFPHPMQGFLECG